MTIARLVLCAAALAPHAGAAAEVHATQVLLRKGDPAGSSGHVLGVGDFDVTSSRQWTATVALDDPLALAAVLKNGRVMAVWGEPTSVPGVFYRDFYTPQIIDSGAVAWPGLVEPIFTYLSGMFLEGKVMLLGGDPGLAPSFPPGLTYRFFQAARLNNDGLLVACDLTSAVPGAPFHQALIRMTSPADGPPAQSVHVQLGDQLPGTAAPVASLPTSLGEFDLNSAGNVAFLAHTEDGTGYVFVDDTIVIREEDTLASLGLPLDRVGTVNLNNGAEWSLHGQAREPSGNLLDVMLVNGLPTAVEGDPVPGLPAFSLLTFYGGELTDDGRALWRARWNDPDPSRDEGLLLGDQLLVQEGVTLVEGQLVTALGRYTISDDGRVLLFSAGLGPGAAEGDNLIRMLLP